MSYFGFTKEMEVDESHFRQVDALELALLNCCTHVYIAKCSGEGRPVKGKA